MAAQKSAGRKKRHAPGKFALRAGWNAAAKPHGQAAARANAQDGKIRPLALEEGVCVLCGGQKPGIPAKKDFAIMFARRMRQVLGQPERHSTACENCIETCLQRRKAFEKEERLSFIIAAAFFFMVVAGGAYFKQFELWLFAPAILGAAIILLLPYGKYFPAFKQ